MTLFEQRLNVFDDVGLAYVLATHILAFEGDSEEVWFEGNFSDYEEARKKRLGDVAPKRVKYQKLA